MKKYITLQNFFIGLGLFLGFIALAETNAASIGFAVSTGLCMIAASLVELANRAR